ncbi:MULTISPECIES: hypothetical protein [Actinomycetes]|jgi:hypothetical protein|uniref:hypothetical protein n=1 Tax=Actinomycetes TaxID=1760 RepID=UPI000BAA4901|nr:MULTISPECIES: hypothetical protein [Actinomycetes]KAA9289858.1 hypothetical protein F6I11_01240 [Corynebacterium amycolatum]MDK8626706.1 hypothetical protein [Corynebacterium appendicis]PAT14977.1 hypothetical protein CKJ84_01310 [Corynebacterium sp. NML 120412]
MSFRDDYAAALRDEQQAKDTVNEARRAHKATKERLAQLRKYAEEFEVNLDGDKSASTEGDGDKSASTEGDGDKSASTEGDSDTPENGDGDTPESTEGSKPKRHLEVVPD